MLKLALWRNKGQTYICDSLVANVGCFCRFEIVVGVLVVTVVLQ